MNYDSFSEGMQISSFIKNTDRIWEGILIIRSDGIKTVLNEQTGRWRRLTDLDNIKILNEDFTTISSGSSTSMIGNPSDNKKIKYDDLKNNFAQEIVGDDPVKAVQNAESVLSNKSALSLGGKNLFTQANTTLDDKSEAPENEETATKDFNDSMKNIAAEAESAKTGDPNDGIEEIKKLSNIQETYKLLHPSLQKFLENDNDDLEYNISKESLDLIQNHLFENKEEKPSKTEKSIKYEDDDYLDLPEEVKSEVMKDILSYLKNKEEDIENKIKKQYELSDSDAEEFVIQGMELYLKNSDVDPKDSIKDIEVEKSFEDTIDNYDGPEDEMLDYLADTYEIEAGEAEKIIEKTQGNLTETIFAFVSYVKNKLKETYDDFVDDIPEVIEKKTEEKELSPEEEIKRDYSRLTKDQKKTYDSIINKKDKLEYLGYILRYRDYKSKIDYLLDQRFRNAFGLSDKDSKDISEERKLGNDFINQNFDYSLGSSEPNRWRPDYLEDITEGDISKIVQHFNTSNNGKSIKKDLKGNLVKLAPLVRGVIEDTQYLEDKYISVENFIDLDGDYEEESIQKHRWDIYQKPVRSNLNAAVREIVTYLKSLEKRPQTTLLKRN
jgi:hypothetical protein